MKTVATAETTVGEVCDALLDEQIGVYVDLRTPIDELRRLCDEHEVPSMGRDM